MSRKSLELGVFLLWGIIWYMTVNWGVTEQVNNETQNPENGLNTEVSQTSVSGYVPAPRPVIATVPDERTVPSTTEIVQDITPKTPIVRTSENVHRAALWAVTQSNAQAQKPEGF